MNINNIIKFIKLDNTHHISTKIEYYNNHLKINYELLLAAAAAQNDIFNFIYNNIVPPIFYIYSDLNIDKSNIYKSNIYQVIINIIILYFNKDTINKAVNKKLVLTNSFIIFEKTYESLSTLLDNYIINLNNQGENTRVNNIYYNSIETIKNLYKIININQDNLINIDINILDLITDILISEHTLYLSPIDTRGDINIAIQYNNLFNKFKQILLLIRYLFEYIITISNIYVNAEKNNDTNIDNPIFEQEDSTLYKMLYGTFYLAYLNFSNNNNDNLHIHSNIYKDIINLSTRYFNTSDNELILDVIYENKCNINSNIIIHKNSKIGYIENSNIYFGNMIFGVLCDNIIYINQIYKFNIKKNIVSYSNLNIGNLVDNKYLVINGNFIGYCINNKIIIYTLKITNPKCNANILQIGNISNDILLLNCNVKKNVRQPLEDYIIEPKPLLLNEYFEQDIELFENQTNNGEKYYNDLLKNILFKYNEPSHYYYSFIIFDFDNLTYKYNVIGNYNQITIPETNIDIFNTYKINDLHKYKIINMAYSNINSYINVNIKYSKLFINNFIIYSISKYLKETDAYLKSHDSLEIEQYFSQSYINDSKINNMFKIISMNPKIYDKIGSSDNNSIILSIIIGIFAQSNIISNIIENPDELFNNLIKIINDDDSGISSETQYEYINLLNYYNIFVYEKNQLKIENIENIEIIQNIENQLINNLHNIQNKIYNNMVEKKIKNIHLIYNYLNINNQNVENYNQNLKKIKEII